MAKLSNVIIEKEFASGYTVKIPVNTSTSGLIIAPGDLLQRTTSTGGYATCLNDGNAGDPLGTEVYAAYFCGVSMSYYDGDMYTELGVDHVICCFHCIASIAITPSSTGSTIFYFGRGLIYSTGDNGTDWALSESVATKEGIIGWYADKPVTTTATTAVQHRVMLSASGFHGGEDVYDTADAANCVIECSNNSDSYGS